MAPDVTLPADPRQQGRTVALPSGARLSPALKAALKSPTRPHPETFELVEQPWTAPASVSLDVRHEAEGRVNAIEQAMTAKAGPDLVRRWLANLGPLVAGTLTEDDAMTKLAAYQPRLADYPLAVFSEASLDRAGRKFSFFPRYGEVAEFLDGEIGRLREEQRRCRAIAAGHGGKCDGHKPERAPATQEQKDAVIAYMDAVRSGDVDAVKRLGDLLKRM